MVMDNKYDKGKGLFNLSNLMVMPFWLLMIIAPRWGFTRKVMSSNFMFVVLGGFYTTLLTAGVLTNPSGMKAIMNPNLDGITKLLGQRKGALTAWTHMIALDLLAGRWIYMDSLERGKPARISLLFTLFAGPCGLMMYLVTGKRKKKVA
jgi:hypothetical protein